MPDPIKGLEDFDPAAAGGAMDPLPASEVRRRGDRLRRRNTALVTVAAAVAVAVVVAPIAVLAGGRDASAPPAGPSPTPIPGPAREWVQEIPAGFDLTRNLPATSESGEPTTQSPNAAGVVPVLDFCGPPLSLGDPLDRLAVNVSGPEYAGDRELLTYADADAAADQVARLHQDAVACPSEGDPATRVNAVLPSRYGPDSLTLTRSNATDAQPQGLGGDVYHVVRVGNAVLLTHTYGEYGPDLTEAVSVEGTAIDPVVGAMCVFSATGCDAGSETASPTPRSAPSDIPDIPDIPAGFPIDLDLPDYGAGGTLEGPSASAPGPETDVCGSSAWPPEARHRLAVLSGGEDSTERRSLLVLDSPDAAVRVMGELRSAAADCRRYSADGIDLVVTPHRAVTGYESVSFSVAVAAGGSRLYLVTRVGSAILAVESGSTTLDASGDRVAEQVDLVRRLAPWMCLWTEAGCPGAPGEPTAPVDPTPPPASDPGDIPAGFPLAVGWPDPTRVEGPAYGLEGPNRTLPPIELEACGSTAADPAYADRLRAGWSNVEDFRDRQLTTYASADEAVSVVDAIGAFYRGCPREPEDPDGFTTLHRVIPTRLGGQSVAVARYAEFQGAPAVGLTTLHVIRVGRAVLVITESSEAGAGPDPDADIRRQLDLSAAEAAEPLAALCAFTEAGC